MFPSGDARLVPFLVGDEVRFGRNNLDGYTLFAATSAYLYFEARILNIVPSLRDEGGVRSEDCGRGLSMGMLGLYVVYHFRIQWRRQGLPYYCTIETTRLCLIFCLELTLN